jgi:hypothetical protein
MYYSMYDADPSQVEHMGIRLHIRAIEMMGISLQRGASSPYVVLTKADFERLLEEAKKTAWQRIKRSWKAAWNSVTRRCV